jgi:hypothetical protein
VSPWLLLLFSMDVFSLVGTNEDEDPRDIVACVIGLSFQGPRGGGSQRRAGEPSRILRESQLQTHPSRLFRKPAES